MNRISREMMLMEIAKTAAKRGTCGRLAVGAILARDSRPISLGYGGAGPGEPHCVEAGCDLTQPCTRTQHAEANAIKWAVVKYGVSVDGADLFTTDSPCAECTDLIIGVKLRRVYFERRYRADELERLLAAGIEVYQLLPNGMLHKIVFLDAAHP